MQIYASELKKLKKYSYDMKNHFLTKASIVFIGMKEQIYYRSEMKKMLYMDDCQEYPVYRASHKDKKGCFEK